MNIKDLSKPLDINDIDFRIQSINKGGYATILAYKSARVDINRLNSVCGSLGWQREHTRDNHNCIVSVWDDDNKQWVSKEDTGTESMAEAQKGLASDSFKRACFNWGIGIELYSYPLIQIKLNGGTDRKQEWFIDNNKPKQGWGLKLKEWTWRTKWTEEGDLAYLGAKDEKGKIRFEYKCGNFDGGEAKIGTESVDLEKIELAYAYFVTQIHNEEQDDIECALKIKKAYGRLSNDEQTKVNEKLKLVKYEKRQLNTILKGYLQLNTEIGE